MAQTPASKRPAAAEQRRKVAEGLVAEARSRITATNRTLIALFLLIVWSWLSNLSAIDLTEGKIGSPRTRFEAIWNATGALEGRCRCRLDQRLVRNQCVEFPQASRNQSSPATPNSRSEETQAEQRRRECGERHRRLISNLQSLSSSFDLFLIRLPDVHLKFHPLLVVIMIAFTFAYATWNRYRVRLLVGEAVNIYKLEIGWKRHLTGVILHSVPVWLWPLSSRPGASPTDEDLTEYLSIDPRSRARFVGFAIMITLLVVITLHTIYMQSVFSRQDLGISPQVVDTAWSESPLDTYERYELKRNYARLSMTGSGALDISILLLLFLPSLVFLWASELVVGLSRKKLRDALGERQISQLSTRRAVLYGGGVIAAIGIVMMPGAQDRLRRWILPLLTRQPRFRANDRSRRTPRETMQRAERAALESLMENLRRRPGKPPTSNPARSALDLLWAAQAGLSRHVDYPYSQIRLFDLLAGLAVRYREPAYLRRLIGIVQAWLRMPVPDSGLRRRRLLRARRSLSARLVRWRSTQSPWRTSWTARDRNWHRIPLPPMIE